MGYPKRPGPAWLRRLQSPRPHRCQGLERSCQAMLRNARGLSDFLLTTGACAHMGQHGVRMGQFLLSSFLYYHFRLRDQFDELLEAQKDYLPKGAISFQVPFGLEAHVAPKPLSRGSIFLFTNWSGKMPPGHRHSALKHTHATPHLHQQAEPC